MLRQTRHIISIALIAIAQILVGQERRDAVTFSQQGGFYDESFELMLMCGAENHIRYTINGSTPNCSSTLYTGPLFLDKKLYSKSNIYAIHTSPESIFYAPDTVQHCISIRAAVFDNNENIISDVTTQSYFINSLNCNTHGLPVISVTTDSLALFDYDTGIYIPGVHFDPNNDQWTGNYYQKGEEWERRINIEYYNPNDNSGINQECGMKTHGGNGRRGTQKSVKFYAREKYGEKKFKYRFFEEFNYKNFKHLVLHPFFNQWICYGINYQMCNTIAFNLGLEALATRPVVLFLNGEYWGIYFLCEKPDEHYLKDHYGGNEEDYNVIGDWYGLCENGDASNFQQMMNWLKNADLTESDNYDYLCSLIDIDNFIDYYCLELFIGNNDWPANNMRCWQHNDGKWRWIFYDGDGALYKQDFDVFSNATDENGPGWPTDAQSTLMFRKLLENDDFKESLTIRFKQLMATQFSYRYTKSLFVATSQLVKDEIPQQATRFNNPMDLKTWEKKIATIDNFLKDRVTNISQQLIELFRVDETTLVFENLYPNPTNGDLYLTLTSEKFTIHDIVIYNMLGQPLTTTYVMLNPGENTVSLSCHYASGIYVVKFGNKTKRFVIQ